MGNSAYDHGSNTRQNERSELFAYLSIIQAQIGEKFQAQRPGSRNDYDCVPDYSVMTFAEDGEG